MADPIANVTEAPAQVASFAKKNPWAFGLLILVGALVVLRYGDKIKLWLASLPVVGSTFAKVMSPGAA